MKILGDGRTKKKKYTIIHYVNHPHKYNKEASEETDLISVTFWEKDFKGGDSIEEYNG